MKLINKFILIYLVVTVIVLGIAGYISFFVIKGELDNELKWRFMDRIDRVTYLLDEGKNFKSKKLKGSGDRNLIIQQLPQKVAPETVIKDTMVWHDRLQQMEPNLKVSAYRTVEDTSYFISTYGALVETDDITEAVVQILLWILGLQVIGAIGVGFIVSGRLFKPFRETLARIKRFNIQDKEPILARETNVEEFNDLNRFVEEMTRKAVKDYKNLKEFAENASHELQTPLSITKGKLELLTETDLTPEQYQYVEASQRSIKKLSRLSESLALLTKIENHEFTNKDEVNVTNLIRESTQAFEEFIKLNGLQVETDLEEDVFLQIHPVLADIMWTNLFQNAIKHNIEDGRIRIRLTKDSLEISNTGKPLDMDTDLLFKRFKKADHGVDSIGLGLSIIEQIVDQNNYAISYDYEDGWHTINVKFHPESV
ncbi:Signal transduction histidine kinase [Fodinibius roseus]|uniref:histidine kinase n=1 Tax=Fodinibius roseus TaxID=1194090 RepID=A0A1M5FLS4_9BACT|nr:HAMP domain-containing sensor histidine kinase [Fodinibius roseus]SHF92112.1 Signal transduction histidine kinase [Fodinibius roseus]